jgi:hypothetical protein
MSDYNFTKLRLEYIEKLKMPLSNFIEKANLKHKNKYDYSKVVYVNARTKVVIICPLHGDFQQVPFSHLKGNGCPKCAIKLVASQRKSNTKEFIDRANIIHNFKYDYSKTEYNFALEKLTIICPLHGEFHQTPDNHLHGKGCRKCTANVSLKETMWLDSLNIPKEYRQYPLLRFKVDGFDPKTNTAYEFNGDYWHGNPKIYDLNKMNKKIGCTFGELYEETLRKEKELKDAGYKVITMWESEFKRSNEFLKG